jgi:hypothetical protein
VRDVAILLYVATLLVNVYYGVRYFALRSRSKTMATRVVARQTELAGPGASADGPYAAALARDRAWDRDILERATRIAFRGQPGAPEIQRIVLTGVDDGESNEYDRAEFAVIAGGETTRVVLTRNGDLWTGARTSAGA